MKASCRSASARCAIRWRRISTCPSRLRRSSSFSPVRRQLRARGASAPPCRSGAERFALHLLDRCRGRAAAAGTSRRAGPARRCCASRPSQLGRRIAWTWRSRSSGTARPPPGTGADRARRAARSAVPVRAVQSSATARRRAASRGHRPLETLVVGQQQQIAELEAGADRPEPGLGEPEEAVGGRQRRSSSAATTMPNGRALNAAVTKRRNPGCAAIYEAMGQSGRSTAPLSPTYLGAGSNQIRKTHPCAAPCAPDTVAGRWVFSGRGDHRPVKCPPRRRVLRRAPTAASRETPQEREHGLLVRTQRRAASQRDARRVRLPSTTTVPFT